MVAWFAGYIDCGSRAVYPLDMLAVIADILLIGAITVVLSFLVGFIDTRHRHGLPWDMRNATDDILVIGAIVIGVIMVVLSLFLFWW